MKWFKVFHDLPDDIKLQRFSIPEKWAWVCLLCLASKSETRGVITAEAEDIAAYCGFNNEMDWLFVRDKLVNKGMVEVGPDGLIICHWETRQQGKPSDAPVAVKERVRRHRDKKRKAQSGDGLEQELRDRIGRQAEPAPSAVDCEIVSDVPSADTPKKATRAKKAVPLEKLSATEVYARIERQDDFESTWRVYNKNLSRMQPSTDGRYPNAGDKKKAAIAWIEAVQADGLYEQFKLGWQHFNWQGYGIPHLSTFIRGNKATGSEPLWKSSIEQWQAIAAQEENPGDFLTETAVIAPTKAEQKSSTDYKATVRALQRS